MKLEAEAEVETKTKELDIVKERVRIINEKLAALQAKLDAVLDQKRIVEEESARYSKKIRISWKIGEWTCWRVYPLDCNCQSFGVGSLNCYW